MSYNANIPQPGDFISNSQGQIQTNFAKIDSSTQGFGVDHVQFSASSNQGKHNKSTYRKQTVDPVTIANEIALYSKTASGALQLFLARASGGTVIQMTPNSGGDPAVFGFAGQSFLPGGIIIKWGNRNAVADGTTITFSADTSAFPTTCYQVFVSVYNANNASTANDFVSVRPGSVVSTGFVVTCSQRTALVANNVSFAYLAIGA